MLGLVRCNRDGLIVGWQDAGGREETANGLPIGDWKCHSSGASTDSESGLSLGLDWLVLASGNILAWYSTDVALSGLVAEGCREEGLFLRWGRCDSLNFMFASLEGRMPR